MQSNTQVTHVAVGDLLGSRTFTVPIYQRSYSWTDEQVNELILDLRAALSRRQDDYFLGSLVFTGSGARDQARAVIDGQQRLATVTMVFAGLRNYFVGLGDDERAFQIEHEYLFLRDFETQQRLPRLMLNAQDRAFFEDNVLARRQAQRATIGRTSPASHKRMAEAFRLVEEEVQKIAKVSGASDIQNLTALRAMFQDRVKVLAFEVADEANAFQIFETLNDRGLDLSIADLLKNYVFGQAGQHAIEQVQSDWQTALSRLDAGGGEKAVRVFIRHFWSSKHGLTRERHLYQSLKGHIRTSADAKHFARELAENALLYAAILNQDHEFWQDQPTGVRQAVGTLLKLRMEQYRPLLLACMAVMPKGDLRTVLQLMVSWSVRFRITQQLGSSAIEQFYGNTGSLVRNGKISSLSELIDYAGAGRVPSDKEFEAAFSTVSVQEGYLARYFLRVLEQEQRRKGGQPELEVINDEEQVNLEHVLPRRARPSDWTDFERDVLDFYTDRLGNMTLLLATENTKIGNRAFAVKRTAFAASSLGITSAIGRRRKWTPDAIEQRQRGFAELAVKAWPLRPT
ncbi:MAG TPA: DUF262 domain-containing protein [Vicinamibacterales bacterium]|nr:DUF262 domain-containing protein [Vicinamibacterales bacterium]